MSIKESATKLEEKLAEEGITEEEIINLYGSVENWVNRVVHIVKVCTR